MGAVVIYADEATKQIIENWADDKGFVAEEQLSLHLEERFGAGTIHVATVTDHGDFLTMQLTADSWEGQREFALLPDGALSW